MELDELKSTWLQLDDRLKNQEILREKMVKEMINKRKNKAASRLIGFEIIGLLCLIITLPLVIYIFSLLKLNFFQNTLMYLLITGMFLYCFSQFWKIYLIGKVNTIESISKIITTMFQYKSVIKLEKKFTYVFVSIAFLFVLDNMIRNFLIIEAWRWIVIILAIPLTIVLFYWQYKIMYKSNIDSIFNSLAELKELEVDTED